VSGIVDALRDRSRTSDFPTEPCPRCSRDTYHYAETDPTEYTPWVLRPIARVLRMGAVRFTHRCRCGWARPEAD
jgi:hypothetical protein